MPKWDVNGESKRLHNEELKILYRSHNIVRAIKSIRLRWAGHVARMEESTGKRPLRRPAGRWEDNIRIDLKEIGVNARNRIDSTQGRDYWRALVNVTLSLRFHKSWS